MDYVGVERSEFQVQEESVEPRGVVVRQVEAGLAFFEKVFVELERVAVGGKFLALGRFHHFADGFFGVDLLNGIGQRIARCLRGLLEDVGEFRVTERVFSDVDAAFRVDDGNDTENDEQADDGKEDF